MHLLIMPILLNIVIPMYNLTEYSDNYSDSSGSLWGFKRDEVTENADVANDNNTPSFKYKASFCSFFQKIFLSKS